MRSNIPIQRDYASKWWVSSINYIFVFIFFVVSALLHFSEGFLVAFFLFFIFAMENIVIIAIQIFQRKFLYAILNTMLFILIAGTLLRIMMEQ